MVVEALVSSRLHAESSPLRALTTREHEILAELAAGKSNAAIASTLVITRRAVEHHITAIFAKLGLPDETEVSRRVRATLLYLADRNGSRPRRCSWTRSAGPAGGRDAGRDAGAAAARARR